jgi:hypothetical protein
VCKERQTRQCGECHVELRAQDVADGRWVGERPDERMRGYHISRLILPELDVPELIEISEKTLPEQIRQFYNRDLGQAWASEKNRLTAEHIQAAGQLGAKEGATANAPGYTGGDLVTMGVDTASERDISVRISRHLDDGRKVSLLIANVSTWSEIDNLMDAFSVRMAAIDHLPDTTIARNLCRRHPGRAYLVAYADSAQDVLTVDPERLKVVVRRTETLDVTFNNIRRGRNLLPAEVPPGYIEEMGNEVREVEENKKGIKVARYSKLGRNDFAHAENYDTVAKMICVYEDITGGIVGKAQEVEALEDHLDYERSALHEDEGYYDGPGGGDYHPGPGG